MTNDEKPRWTKINIKQPVQDLIEYGPSFEMGVTSTTTGETIKVLAQLDTGAAGTGVSKRLSQRLALMPHGAWGEVHEAGREPLVVPYHLVRLGFPHGDFELEAACLPSLGEPHDVLIGRDILKKCRLDIDFTTGVTTLLIRS